MHLQVQFYLTDCIIDEDIGSLSDSSSKVISDEEEVGNDGIADVPKTLTAVDLFVQRQEKLMKKKESIALVASQLVENPEGNVGENSFIPMTLSLFSFPQIDWSIETATFAVH